MAQIRFYSYGGRTVSGSVLLHNGAYVITIFFHCIKQNILSNTSLPCVPQKKENQFGVTDFVFILWQPSRHSGNDQSRRVRPGLLKAEPSCVSVYAAGTRMRWTHKDHSRKEIPLLSVLPVYTLQINPASLMKPV